ncbi:MAG: methyltransferase domain-containing protein [Candidatus Woesearchaeota archaeon]
MDEKEQFSRLIGYFEKSRLGYDVALGGAKHFGFHPKGKKINEKKAQALMQDLVAKKLGLSAKDFALDAGCGQGVVAAFLAKNYGCRIEGITMVPFEIDEANNLAKKAGVMDKVHYSLMDYNKMNFEENHFDCIYTTETLSHSTDVRKTLKEFYRVLKKNGRIALFEYTISDAEKLTAYERKMIARIAHGSAMDALKDFRHDKFQKMLKEAGFKKIQSENISENTGPSLGRFRKYALLPYYLYVKPLGLQEKHPNISAAIEFYNMGKKGMIRYMIFTAIK